MANMIKFTCILNFLLHSTLTVIDTFLSGYKTKEAVSSKDNEAGSSTEKGI
jgi:hypothetical protein